MPSSLHRRALDWTTIALFLLALLAPTLDQLARPVEARDTRQSERRKPTPLPPRPRNLSDLTAFPRRYEDHYEETFGLRDVLLAWNARERWFGLGLSPADLAEPAADGWCFLSGPSRDVFRGVAPLSHDQIEGWVRRLHERRDFLAGHGIRYLFVLCPNKETIYPERVPASWNQLGPTPFDQLVARLADEPDAPFLDLRPALRAAKAGDRPEDWLYTSFGTHWNGRGGRAAYVAVIERLQRDFPELQAVPFEECQAIEAEGDTDSLARQLYLDDRIRQRQYGLRLPEPGYEIGHASTYQAGALLITHKEIEAPRLLWLHDSFGPLLDRLLCESFSYVQAHWGHEFPVDAVFDARPDVVLETYVERFLVEQEPYSPIDARTDPPEVEFEAAESAWRASPNFDGVLPFGEAVVERRPDELRVDLLGPRSGVLLLPIALESGQRALLRLVVDCPAPTEVNVFVRPIGARTFLLKDQTRVALGPETGTAVVRLPAVGVTFETLLRFKTSSSSLGLREIEVRRSAPGER